MSYSRVACAILACVMLGAAVVVDAAVTCNQVQQYVSPCTDYLTNRPGDVISKCCQGVRSANNAFRTTPDRQTACKCITQLVHARKGLNLERLKGLPGRCGVSIPNYAIRQNFDCKR